MRALGTALLVTTAFGSIQAGSGAPVRLMPGRGCQMERMFAEALKLGCCEVDLAFLKKLGGSSWIACWILLVEWVEF